MIRLFLSLGLYYYFGFIPQHPASTELKYGLVLSYPWAAKLILQTHQQGSTRRKSVTCI